MHFLILSLVFVVATALSQAEDASKSANDNPNVWNFQIARKIIASFQYKGMGMSIWEDQGVENSTITSKRQFYVTPITELLPNSSVCEYSDFTGAYFISFSIQFWNDRLQMAAVDRLKQMQIDVIQEQVQPLPFYQVRAIWNSAEEKLQQASLSSTWNNNLQQKSIHQFKLFTDDKAACERLAHAMTTRPELFTSSIAVEYSLSAASTATRTITVTVDHFMNSKLMATLKNMNSDGQERFLTSEDANRLTLEILDNIVATQVVDGEYIPDSDQITLKGIVSNAMQFKDVNTGNFTEKMWESVYWDPTYARPDKITSYLNKVLDINQGNHTVTKSDQYSDKGEGGIDFGINGLFNFGGKGSGESSSSSSFSELYEWLLQHNYEVDIKGDIFIPKSLNLQRLNLGVLSRQETIFTKSVQMHHVDAPGLLTVTVGEKSFLESEDIKRLRQSTDSAISRLNQLEPRTSKLETRVEQIEPKLTSLTAQDGQLDAKIESVRTSLSSAIGAKISACQLCVKPGPDPNRPGGEMCTGWSNAPAFFGGKYCTGDGCSYILRCVP